MGVAQLSCYCLLDIPSSCDYFKSLCFEPSFRTEGYSQLSKNSVDTWKVSLAVNVCFCDLHSCPVLPECLDFFLKKKFLKVPKVTFKLILFFSVVAVVVIKRSFFSPS